MAFMKRKDRIVCWIIKTFIPKYVQYWVLITVLNDIQDQGGAFQAKMIDVIEKYSAKYAL